MSIGHRRFMWDSACHAWKQARDHTVLISWPEGSAYNNSARLIATTTTCLVIVELCLKAQYNINCITSSLGSERCIWALDNHIDLMLFFLFGIKSGNGVQVDASETSADRRSLLQQATIKRHNIPRSWIKHPTIVNISWCSPFLQHEIWHL